MKHIPRGQYLLKPWKNGLGTTQEILVYPEGSDDFLFRLSMAALSQSGPFSLFPGIERTLVLLEGEPIKLNDKVVPLLSPVEFSGEENIEATILAPGLDFNLMCRRGKVVGRVSVLSGVTTFTKDSNFCLIFALTNNVSINELKIQKYDSVLLEDTDRLAQIEGESFLRIDLDFI